MTDLVIISDDGPVRTVRMNRPDKKNALTLDMYDAMAAAIESAPQSPALRCLLIAGTPTGFCAGNDIGDFLKMAAGEGALGAPIIRFLHALARCELPLIAAVQGNAREVRVVGQIAPAVAVSDDHQPYEKRQYGHRDHGDPPAPLPQGVVSDPYAIHPCHVHPAQPP